MKGPEPLEAEIIILGTDSGTESGTLSPGAGASAATTNRTAVNATGAPWRVVAAEFDRAGIGEYLTLELGTERDANPGHEGDRPSETDITAMDFDAESDRWRLRFPDGRRYRARLIVATVGSGLADASVTGPDGLVLRDIWREGPASFLGIAVHGLPNLFITGLDYGGAATPVQARYIRQCVQLMRRTGSTRMEVRGATQHEFLRRTHSNTIVTVDGSTRRRAPLRRAGSAHRALSRPNPRHFDLTVAADREPAHEYSGPAMLDAPGAELPVTVTLNGHPDPIDGRYHWYGRITGPNPADLPDPGRGQVQLTLPGGTPTAGTLQERDPWGELRIVGVGDPPYPLASAESR